jgi:xylulokinase
VDLFIGLDVGTTTAKCELYDATGRPVADARSADYAISRPRPSWAEQDAADWWTATRACLSATVAAAPAGSRIAAVGVAGQFSQLLTGAEGNPVAPAVLWQDGRAEAEAAELSRVDADVRRGWLGADLPMEAATPAARLLWFHRHRPELLGPGTRLLQPKDWVAHRLTGVLASDVTSALWVVDQRTGTLDPEYAELLGIGPELLPPLHRPYEVIGEVTRSAATQTGLPAGTPVVAGWIDTWAGILGTGLGLDRRAFDLAGTSEAVGLASPPPASRPAGLLDVPLDEHLDVVYALTNAGADSYRWAAECLYTDAAVHDGYRHMEREAAAVRAGEDGLVFLPYLAGERSPVWDAGVRAAFVGLDRDHTRAHLTRAVYEGLAFCVRQLLDAACEATGVTPVALRVSGGGGRSPLANQVKADVTGLPVETVAVPDAGTLGAAMLAAIGAGAYSGYADAVAGMVRPGRVFEPDGARHDALDDAYATYRALYSALRHHSRRRETAR